MCKENNMKILIAMVDNEQSATFLTEKNLAALDSLGTVIWDKSVEKITPDWLRDNLVDIDICVCSWGVPKFTAEVLEKANKLAAGEKYEGLLDGSGNIPTDAE